MHEAAAGEGHEVGLALAPVGERGGPLPGAADLVGVLTGQDHAAVDDPRDDRGELACGDSHHRLVESPRPSLGARPDQDVALLVGGEREQVRVAEALADRRRLAGGGSGRLEVAVGLLLEDDWQQQIAALDAVASFPSSSRWARPSQPPARPISPGGRG